MDSPDHRQGLRGDALCALALSLVLSAAWAWRDWSALSALHLPDTDDMMRLQQIRDWLGGQPFGDVSQHRLGAAPGLAMHWSRLPDLVPGAIVAALTPLVGAHAAELCAVLAWPASLFAAALLLTARIARALGGLEGGAGAIASTAAVVAAIAYPATTVFLPGRIDHHGLQVVLLLVVARTLVAAPSMGAGLVAGFAATASLVVGLETAPLLAAAGFAMAAQWVLAKPGADDRVMGFGIALGAGLLAASIVFRSDAWGYPGCDGFTAAAWRAGVLAAFAPMALALAARGTARPMQRAVLGVLVAGVVGGGIVLMAPACLHPYGLVDPLLARLWLVKVGEAQPLFDAPPATAIGYAGVMLAGTAGSAWALYATRDRRWAMLLVLQLAACGLTATQLRGAYAGAMLAAPGLAAVIAAARARGAGWLAAAWAASAGMLYPIAAQAMAPSGRPDPMAPSGRPNPMAPSGRPDPAAPSGRPDPAAARDPGGSCTAAPALAELAALPSGRLLAPLDLGAYALGATRLSVVGAPYHRGNDGNLAVYRFFLGSPDGAARIARDWRVRYVVLCPDAFGDAPPAATAGLLRHGAAPHWLRRVPTRSPALMLYTVEPGLFPRR